MGSSRANVTLCPICRGNNSPVFIIRLDGASAVWWNDHSAPRAVFQWGSVCCFIVTFWPMMRHSVRVVCSLKCSISLHLHFAASSAPHVFSHSFLTPASLLSLFCVSFQKMFFFLLPVVALLLSRETVVSANNNEKWLGTVAQYKDRSWNRFRDVSCSEKHNI